MSDTIIAQRRGGRNDMIHLYRDEIKSYTSKENKSGGLRIAYCSKKLDMNPDLDVLELEESDLQSRYLVRDDEVVGRICENCRKVYQGVCHANE